MSLSNSTYKRRRSILFPAGIIAAFLVALFIASSANISVAEANGAPPACQDDNGDPVEPLPFPGAWAIILNFNHTPSPTHTTACWAIRDNTSAMNVTYTTGILCQVRNNVNNVKVGNGEANFDGNFHITCPRRGSVPNPTAVYDTFYVHAVAEFPETAGYYPLVRHSNVSVRAHLKAPVANEAWKATMISRYGDIVFSDTQDVPRLTEINHRINSTVFSGTGSHLINSQQQNSQTTVDPFTFDFTELIFIGGGDNPWTLSEMVIDPPGFCMNC